jgi:tetratricopeptide (TPR) repeat protein
VSASVEETISFMMTVVHLNPATALAEVERYVQEFQSQSWPVRLRGEAQRRLGNLRAAMESLQEALQREEIGANLLALAHFHLELGDLQFARDYADQALASRPGDALCLLSQAVLLWEKGQVEDALARLAHARRRDPDVVHPEDLAYEHFWGPKALAAVEAMLAQVDGNRP